MTATAHLARGLDAPDPAAFVAEATPLPTGSTLPLAAAAAHGHVVADRTRTVAALGAAGVLGLPEGLGDPRALRAVTAWLQAVEVRHHEDGRQPREAGAPPAVTAVGAFPFDPEAPATLVVPATTWCEEPGGRAWRVDVRRREDPAPAGAGAHVGARSPARPGAPPPAPGPELEEVPPGHRYADAVGRALGDIRAGRLRKVVLSRSVEVRLPYAPDPAAVLDRLWAGDAAFRPYSVPVGDARMVGASPELLVARRGSEVVSHAFAGTVALADGDEDAVDRLLASTKDLEEHRLVVEAIAGTLGPRCARLAVPALPSVVRLRSDARLGSLLVGQLRQDDSALEVLGMLHPTPAVGGVPSERALARIAELEPPRGPWAGAVGWVDAAGDGSWVLAIRSAVLRGTRATVRAGAGIVAASDPERELAETTVKLAPVLEALWPGASSLL